jgi:hypothetical protein
MWLHSSDRLAKQAKARCEAPLPSIRTAAPLIAPEKLVCHTSGPAMPNPFLSMPTTDSIERAH